MNDNNKLELVWLNFQLSKETKDAVRILAAQTRISISEVARRAVDAYLERVEAEKDKKATTR